MSNDFEELELAVSYRFARIELLRTALTHSSHANEAAEPMENNERLEFLGDAVLELVVTGELFDRFPEADEGKLTSIRSGLVKERSLAEAARSIGLDKHVLLGRGEEAQGGRERDSLLADAMEALIGAVYQDGGFHVAGQVVLEVLKARFPERAEVRRIKDFKSRLQEATQQLWGRRPVYVLIGSSGPEHEKLFEVKLTLPEGEEFFAAGSGVKRAEQSCAAAALEFLEDRSKE